MIHLNKHCKIKLSHIGEQKTPVIIIDELLADCHPLREFAQTRAQFEAEKNSYYPGRRAQLPQAYLDTLNTFFIQLIKQVYKIDGTVSGLIKPSVFSLLTRDESALLPEQCIPHYDSKLPRYFAMTHYLNFGEFSGTAFYRNRQSGIEVVNQNNVKDYINAINGHVQTHGMFEQKYFSDSSDMFELMGVVPWQENRAVVYPGGLLHSPYIDNVALNVRNSIKQGRLTANLFIDLTDQPN
ncbi:DUF6445 family protein [Gayadomonas joobiniege]|uniref:DUF6445 family protein n=1 Tax=Gayadomonas joobiniege TaxID=1234606 RepID=UPI00035F1D90|nr:DUF6445 family protein [Gayadomonas joobiniege]